MSTLVTHHEGMDRVLRGVETFVEMLYGRGGARVSTRAGTKVARPAKPAPIDASDRQDAALQQVSGAGSASLLSRWLADRARRRQDREFEALMRVDERVRSDFLAAKARAEWDE